MAQGIKREAEASHEEAGQISSMVDSLSNNLDSIGEDIEAAEARAENEKNLVSTVSFRIFFSGLFYQFLFLIFFF